MIAWAWFTMPSPEEMQRRQAEQARQDSIAATQPADTQQRQTDTLPEDTSEATPQGAAIGQNPDDAPPQMGSFSAASASDTTSLVVNTPLYRTVFTSVGAGPKKFYLKEHDNWDHSPVQMIDDTTRSTYSVGFLTTENLNVETDRLVFEQITPSDSLTLQEGETDSVVYALTLDDNRQIRYIYTLNGDSYEIDLKIRFQGLQSTIIGQTIELGWKSGLNFTERDVSQEGIVASSYIFAGGELEQLLLSEGGYQEQNVTGNIDWVATRTKFFGQYIKPQVPTDGAVMMGELSGEAGLSTTEHRYKTFVSVDIPPDGTAQFRLYSGPLSYRTLSQFDDDAYDLVDVGYSFIRWFSDPLVRYMIIPYFHLTEDYFHLNFGIAIIIFGILIKLVLYPLTVKSYRSMAAMKELQPQLKELQEKYKDDPQKQQKATLKLYKEAKVNPLGGCLPNLLQLPILLTLWRFFQNSIMIRQEEFLWAEDLSAPDYILSLPFEIPFLGDQLAGFVLLMTVAMVFQSRMMGGMGGMGGGGGGGAMAGQMKMLQYIFPVMLLFIFNNFAAGLSLYYLVYNVMTIGQQLLINSQLEKEKEAGELVNA